jgi:hypothetical protein
MINNTTIKKLVFRAKSHLIPFSHKKAQEYELESNKKWMDNHFAEEYQEKTANTGKYSDEWFRNQYDWERFVNWTSGKSFMEIGSGPTGNITGWWWAQRKIIIDPLIHEYKQYQLATFGKTVYTDDIELVTTPAEEFIPKYAWCINGAIVCRNTLDHCDDPIAILENIAMYATKGTYLLLWTDLYHHEGHDEGHTNITKDRDEFRKLIEDLGFEIEYETPVKKDRNTVQFGCRARKQEMRT